MLTLRTFDHRAIIYILCLLVSPTLIYLTRYYIKQHISQLVAGHYEATYEGQSNSSDAIISMMEVKRVFVSWIYGFLTVINMEPINKMWLNVS